MVVKKKKADTYVTKVTDLTGEEEQVLKLEYDRDGKIIKYGDTPVRYEGDQINHRTDELFEYRQISFAMLRFK